MSSKAGPKGKRGSTSKTSRATSRAADRVIFETRLVETRYGPRLLVRQGDNRIWLRPNDIIRLIQTLLDHIWAPEEESSEGGEGEEGQ